MTTPMRFWIAIDDTDNLESIGTGRLARMLARELAAAGLIADGFDVTRHQFLVHDAIPYTSHNSSSCIEALAAPGAADAIFERAQRFLLANEHDGANPGLCVAREDEVPAALPELGRRAQTEVLDLGAFDREITPHRLRVWSRGETGQGRIGAVCGVALRSTRNDGRFIHLRGIRDVGGVATVAEILDRSGVESVELDDGLRLERDEKIDTLDWVRPNLCEGRIVLRVRREGERLTPVERHSKDDG